MRNRELLDDRFEIRINSNDKKNFINQCCTLKRQYQSLLREMIKAVNEGRFHIRATEEQLKIQEELYNDN